MQPHRHLRWLPLVFLCASLSVTAAPRDWYVATNGGDGAADQWSSAFTNLQDALDLAGDGDTIHVAGQAFGGGALSGTYTVFNWQSVSNVTLRGGYEADPALPLVDHPGTNNPSLWPTVLSRTSGNARVLTMTGLSNCVIDSVTVSNGYLTENPEVGGGLRFSNCRDVTLANSRVVNNRMIKFSHYQNHHGGGIYFHSSRVTLTNSVIANNAANETSTGVHADSHGGGAYVDGSSEITIVRSFLLGNTSTGKRLRHGYGGALHVASGGVLDVRETVMVNNTAGSNSGGYHGYGGAVANYGTTRLRNTLVVSNTASSGHSDGLWSSGVSALLQVENATVADNNTVGIRYGSGTVIVSNSIVWGHSQDLVDIPVTAGGILTNIWYSNIGDGQNAGQQGCVSVEPLFADRATYHLQSTEGYYTNGYFSGGAWTTAASNSPLIDAADPNAPFEREPMRNGGRLNMGAYGNTEVAAKTPDIEAVLPTLANPGALLVKRNDAILRGVVTDTGGNMPQVWFRYWADGSATTNEISVGYVFDAFWRTANDLSAGTTYYYRVRAVNSAGTTNSAIASFETHPVPSTLYVSTNGNQTAGTSWATAYNELETVWGFAGPGDTINVAGRAFAREAALGDVTVFRWDNATNVTLRGGFEADPALPLVDHPGTNNPALWPTVLARIGRNARVLTLTGLSNSVIDSVTVSNGYLTANTEVGGGIRFSNCRDVTLANSRIVNNSMAKFTHYQNHHGGGIYFHASRTTITNCVIANNVANQIPAGNYHANAYGGGAYVDGNSDVVVFRSFLLNNTAPANRLRTAFGGALYIAAGGKIDVRETVIAGNHAIGSGADGYGGAIANDGTLRLRNVLVFSNQSNTAHSDGIWTTGASGDAVIDNVTVADNNEVGVRYGGGSLAISNSIVSGHTADLVDLPESGGVLPDVWYSCIGDGQNAGHQGCFSLDPLFADRITYHLQSREGHYTNDYFSGGAWTNANDDSPLIDAGDPAGAYSREPTPNGSRLNMGAYGNTEVAAKTLPVIATLPTLDNPGALAWQRDRATLRGVVTDTGGDMPEVWFQYWQDGGAATNEIGMGFVFDAFQHTVTGLVSGTTYHYGIRAINSAGATQSVAATFSMHPSPSTLYVSTNGNNTAGATWATAYPSLVPALEFASPGDTIHVAGQTFAREADLGDVTVYRWENATNITLRGGYQADPDLPVVDHPGANDPDQWPSVLQRIGRSARVLTLSGLSNCVIEHITIRDGYLQEYSEIGGGILINACHGLIFSDCRILENRMNKTSNYGPHQGGGLCFIASHAAVSNSVIAGNDANYITANNHAIAEGGGLYVNGASVVNVYDSRFDGNSAKGKYRRHGYGGALFVAAGGILDVRNSILSDNNASGDGDGNHGIGGAVANNGRLWMRNILVISNQSNTAHSDGIWSGGATADAALDNLTVADNYAVGIRYGDGLLSVSNSIIWGHSTNDLATFPDDGEGHLQGVGYSLFDDPSMDGVNGCLTNDPLFLDAAAGNYRLNTAFGREVSPDTWVHDAQTSPAIDAGMNHPWHAGATDLDGNPRLKRGRFDRTVIRVDLGAYERTARPRGSLILIQ